MTATFNDRLLLALKRIDKKPYWLAQQTGIGDSTVRNWVPSERGDRKLSVPSLDAIPAIADALEVSVEWLVSGRGEMTSSRVGAERSATSAPSMPYIPVPRMDGMLPAIMDGSDEQIQAPDFIAFRESWLKSVDVMSIDLARMLMVKGDAMAPTLAHGDVALVDVGSTDAEELGIYVIRADDRLLVRRIVPRIDGSLQVMCDNPMYPAEIVTADNVGSLHIVGQVRWYGRTI